MTAKERFLDRLALQISSARSQLKMLEDAYEFNKGLPDVIFTDETVAPLPPIDLRPNTIKINELLAEEGDYGRNKKLVRLILDTADKALLTKEIEKQFREMIGSNKDESKAVNNTLSALQKDGEVLTYKPSDFKIRGLFYTLSVWWVAGNLMREYRPIAANYKGING